MTFENSFENYATPMTKEMTFENFFFQDVITAAPSPPASGGLPAGENSQKAFR